MNVLNLEVKDYNRVRVRFLDWQLCTSGRIKFTGSLFSRSSMVVIESRLVAAEFHVETTQFQPNGDTTSETSVATGQHIMATFLGDGAKYARRNHMWQCPSSSPGGAAEGGA